MACSILKIAVYFLLILAVTKPLGPVHESRLLGEKTFLDPLLRPLERLIYRLGGVDAEQRADWKQYTIAMLVFSAVGLLLTYAIQRAAALSAAESRQARRGRARSGLEHRRLVHHEHELAGLRGESTMSHLTQMVGLTFHNFVSAAAGIALAIALIRGIARQQREDDRQLLGRSRRAARSGVLLPLSLVAAIVLMSQGVDPELPPDRRRATTLEGDDAEDPAGADRLAGSDQGARHERRRILQRQLRASLREPDAVHQPPADVPHLRASAPASATRSAR